MPKVSVIIPVYGVEDYIEKCARSLFEQTLNEIEYIFIDDCTPDRSIEILRKVICEYDQRLISENKIVKIIKMPFNSGPFAVRKKGIELSTGSYVIHCDSDDWVDVDMLQYMYKKAVSTMADIVICDYITINNDGYTERHKGVLHDSWNKIFLNMLQAKISWSMCNKLINRKLYDNNIIFPTYTNGEDMVVISQLVYYAKKIEYISKPYYFYYKNRFSITRNVSEPATFNRFIQGVNNVIVVQDFFSTRLRGRLYRDAIDNMKFIQLRLLEPLLRINKKKYHVFWKTTFPELKFRVWMNPNISFRNKVKFYFYLMRSW